MAQITVNDISLGYDGVTVCENLSFSVEAGDYLCIVGNNGSGKSTLMKALLRLKSPEKGEITLSAIIINGEPLKKLVFFVFIKNNVKS